MDLQKIGLEDNVLLLGDHIPLEGNGILLLIRLHRVGDNINRGTAGGQPEGLVQSRLPGLSFARGLPILSLSCPR